MQVDIGCIEIVVEIEVQFDVEMEIEVVVFSLQLDQFVDVLEFVVVVDVNGVLEILVIEIDVIEIFVLVQLVVEFEEVLVVIVEVVEFELDKVFVVGMGELGLLVCVYVGDDYQGEVQVNVSGKWLVEGDKNVVEGDVEVCVDLIVEDGNIVDVWVVVIFEKQQEQQIVLIKVIVIGIGGGVDGQGVDVCRVFLVVIICKGDNLWWILC